MPRTAPNRQLSEVFELGWLMLPGRGMTMHQRARMLHVDKAQAADLVRVAQVWRHRGIAKLKFDQAALLVLAADDVPEIVRELAIERARLGTRITKSLALSMIQAGIGE